MQCEFDQSCFRSTPKQLHCQKYLNRRVLLAIALFGASCATPTFADQTNSQPIAQVLYNGSVDYLFIVGSSSWVATSCNATYIQILPGVSGKDKMMAIALAAYMAGKSVQFQGTCDATPGYFDATYITVTG
jgi:hypothetical protein